MPDDLTSDRLKRVRNVLQLKLDPFVAARVLCSIAIGLTTLDYLSYVGGHCSLYSLLHDVYQTKLTRLSGVCPGRMLSSASERQCCRM
jgi:hypothetical protein